MRRRRPRGLPDPADLGTAFGLETSLAQSAAEAEAALAGAAPAWYRRLRKRR